MAYTLVSLLSTIFFIQAVCGYVVQNRVIKQDESFAYVDRFIFNSVDAVNKGAPGTASLSIEFNAQDNLAILLYTKGVQEAIGSSAINMTVRNYYA